VHKPNNKVAAIIYQLVLPFLRPMLIPVLALVLAEDSIELWSRGENAEEVISLSSRIQRNLDVHSLQLYISPKY